LTYPTIKESSCPGKYSTVGAMSLFAGGQPLLHGHFNDVKCEGSLPSNASRIPKELSFWEVLRFPPFVLLVTATGRCG